VRPQVGVIVPTYNRARPVEQASQTVADQTYPNSDMIVFDDGRPTTRGTFLQGYRWDLWSGSFGSTAIVE
jgi:GT2 family glycosyltransferase